MTMGKAEVNEIWLLSALLCEQREFFSSLLSYFLRLSWPNIHYHLKRKDIKICLATISYAQSMELGWTGMFMKPKIHDIFKPNPCQNLEINDHIYGKT